MFSLATCPHCRRAKQLLSDHGIKYEDISLSAYPEKRIDMLKASNRLTVPQIFFGELHVGGAAALEEIIEASDVGGDALKKLIDEHVIGKPDPSLPELQVPDYPPKEKRPVAERTEELICVGEMCYKYQELNSILCKGLEIGTHGKYRDSFTGQNLINMLLKTFKSLQTRDEAVQVAKSLHASRFFDHVTHTKPFVDAGDMIYRLQQHAQPFILNQFRWWNDRVDDAMLTVGACKSALSSIVSRHRNGDGLVDYVAVAEDDAFSAFEESVCELQAIQMQDMPCSVRLAFCINVYNMMIPHAFAKVGVPKTNMQRLAFFDHIKYNIGGSLFSFSDIENGLLRGNKLAPFHLSKPFSRNDPRTKCSLTQPDPRIHFALNCGAKSCPPVKDYTSDAIDEELRIVALAFMESDESCVVDVSTRTIHLSKIFSWYKSDFGKSKDERTRLIATWLSGSKKDALDAILTSKGGDVRVRYLKYDWTTDACNARSYSDGKCTIL